MPAAAGVEDRDDRAPTGDLLLLVRRRPDVGDRLAPAPARDGVRRDRGGPLGLGGVRRMERVGGVERVRRVERVRPDLARREDQVVEPDPAQPFDAVPRSRLLQQDPPVRRQRDPAEPTLSETRRTPNRRPWPRGSSSPSGSTSHPSSSATSRRMSSVSAKSRAREIVSRGPTYTVDRGCTPLTTRAVDGSRTRPLTGDIAHLGGGAGSRSRLRGPRFASSGRFSTGLVGCVHCCPRLSRLGSRSGPAQISNAGVAIGAVPGSSGSSRSRTRSQEPARAARSGHGR